MQWWVTNPITPILLKEYFSRFRALLGEPLGVELVHLDDLNLVNVGDRRIDAFARDDLAMFGRDFLGRRRGSDRRTLPLHSDAMPCC